MTLRARGVLFAGAAVVLGIVVAVAAVEIVVRMRGYSPRRFLGSDTRNPIVFEADPILGWRPIVGTFIVPAYDWSGPPRITITPERARSTGDASGAPPNLVVIGCSFTFGWGVSDNETFAARLQQRHPEWHVMNLGVPGYGTYQSLLRLEQLLASGVKPARVLYGYMQGHETRNVAHPFWLQQLEKFSTQGMVAVPYVTLDNHDQLVRHAPIRYPGWPLGGTLATVPLLELPWALYRARDRIDQFSEVTDHLVVEMAKLCKAHGIDFALVLLEADAPSIKDHYARLLGSRDIKLIDCAIVRTPDMVVPHDGHPNARANGIYAACLEKALTAPPRS
jgi:hypothetical protein